MAKNENVENARFQLLDLLPKNAIGVEVGAWKGDFTKDILKEIAPRKLYIIDPYKFYGEYDNAWYGGSIGEQEKMNLIHDDFVKRFEKSISQGKLIMLRNESSEGLNRLEDNSVDYTYIDGNHTYDFVLEDLEISMKKVKTGGFITGDDYNLVGWWEDGVTKAVFDFGMKYYDKVRLIYVNETQFAFRKL